MLASLGAGCGDDEDDVGHEARTPTTETSQDIALSDRLPERSGGFVLVGSSVETAPGSVSAGALEAIVATYADPQGGRVQLTLVEFESPEQATARLDAVVEMRRGEGWEQPDATLERDAVVLTRSAGVQARPPDVAYGWITGSRFALAEGIGDAASRLYAVVDLSR